MSGGFCPGGFVLIPGEPFRNFRDLSHDFGELFNIIGELLTNCVLAILKDLANFGKVFLSFCFI